MPLTKKDVVVVAVARLGGSRNVVATEDIAIEAHGIDERAFGWKKYRDRVDLDVARVSLRHEGESRLPRVEGSIQNGWHLTPAGAEWLAQRPSLLEKVSGSVLASTASVQARRAETRERGAALNRVLGSDAFGLWRAGQEFSPAQAAAVFRIDEYTPPKDRSHKTAQLQDLVKGEHEIDSFVRLAIPVALKLQPPRGREETQSE